MLTVFSTDYLFYCFSAKEPHATSKTHSNRPDAKPVKSTSPSLALKVPCVPQNATPKVLALPTSAQAPLPPQPVPFKIPKATSTVLWSVTQPKTPLPVPTTNTWRATPSLALVSALTSLKTKRFLFIGYIFPGIINLCAPLLCWQFIFACSVSRTDTYLCTKK